MIDQTVFIISSTVSPYASVVNPKYFHLESIQYASQIPPDFRCQSITALEIELAS